jgi:AcrR family transcriptional regulator
MAVLKTVSSGGRLRTIVDRAAELFDRDGYARVSVADIAAAVGIRKPTLYHYVESKEEILALIHQEFMTLVFDAGRSRADQDLSPADAVRATMADILRLMETHRGHVRVFFEHHRELPESERRRIAGERDRYAAGVRTILAAGVQCGAFRAVDLDLTTLALFGMCNWAYQWYEPGGKLSPDQVAGFFADILLRGILEEPPR